jgi:hypothetical protein
MILDDGEPVGRLYEDASAGTPAGLRWFWSVTVYVNPKAGIVTSGKAPRPAGGKGAVRGTAWWLAGMEHKSLRHHDVGPTDGTFSAKGVLPTAGQKSTPKKTNRGVF